MGITFGSTSRTVAPDPNGNTGDRPQLHCAGCKSSKTFENDWKSHWTEGQLRSRCYSATADVYVKRKKRKSILLIIDCSYYFQQEITGSLMMNNEHEYRIKFYRCQRTACSGHMEWPHGFITAASTIITTVVVRDWRRRFRWRWRRRSTVPAIAIVTEIQKINFGYHLQYLRGLLDFHDT